MHHRHQLMLVFAILLLAASPGLAQEPTTRAESLAREREAKAAEPPVAAEPTRLERLLLNLESGRLFERLLNPPQGIYPKIGNITSGSGMSVGPAYRKPGLLGGHANFEGFIQGSLKKYWMMSATLTMPDLARGRLFADLHARRFDFPQEEFFGLGADSLRENETTYGLQDTVLGAGAGIRLAPWLSLRGGVDHLSPAVGSGDGDRSVEDVFAPSLVPGFTAQPDFLRYEAVADLNYREPRGNPRSGGQYRVALQQYDDRDFSRYDFRRIDVDLQQYVPLLSGRRVLAFRALTSVTDAEAGKVVPFYLQPSLGGPDDLRGFRRLRFRDQNMILFQAEYRWEIFTAVDGAIFYDAGKVTSRREDLGFSDLESDYGIGFRFGTINGVFLRIEGAFGSSGGKHFIFRFGHVF